MLAPNSRVLYSHLWQAPPGYRFDRAIATTFTLDLVTLLMLPYSLASQGESEPDALLGDPIALLEGLREHTGRLAVFCQHGRIQAPKKPSVLLGLLDDYVVPVRPAAPAGVFHPKLWLLRFVAEDHGTPLIRAVVLSRNLTFDRCWDTALCLEGTPTRKRCRASYALADLVEALPGLAVRPVSPEHEALAAELADELRTTRFDAPEPFAGDVRFHVFGVDGASGSRPWERDLNGKRVLAVSPFLSQSAVRAAGECASEEWLLVAREEELDDIPQAELDDGWEVSILADALETHEASDQTDSDSIAPATGLHAKLIAIEHGWHATWWIGSANLSHMAWYGGNIELMIELTGKRKRVGIDSFMNSGFRQLLTSYVRSEPDPEAVARKQAEKTAEAVRDAIAAAELSVTCEPAGDHHDLRLCGAVTQPEDVDMQDIVDMRAWPATLTEGAHACALTPLVHAQPVCWPGMAKASITSLIAFSVTARHGSAQATVAFTLALPHTGFPAGRNAQIARDIVSDHKSFFRYLRLLLALDGDSTLAGAPRLARTERGKSSTAPGMAGLDEVVLEDLIRAFSREPARLEAIDRLIADLQAGEHERASIPPEFLALWETIRAARRASGKGDGS